VDVIVVEGDPLKDFKILQETDNIKNLILEDKTT
jgi:hypothetical protein